MIIAIPFSDIPCFFYPACLFLYFWLLSNTPQDKKSECCYEWNKYRQWLLCGMSECVCVIVLWDKLFIGISIKNYSQLKFNSQTYFSAVQQQTHTHTQTPSAQIFYFTHNHFLFMFSSLIRFFCYIF